MEDRRARYGPECDTPVERPAMLHWWDELAFLHWRVEPVHVQRLLPAGLDVETFDGSAWVGLVPFLLRVGLPHVRPIPWVSRFAETNVRTYVTGRDDPDRNGIWFFSLDAARLGAVITARATYRIPYFWSDMTIDRGAPSDTRIEYRCRRRWPGPHRGATSRVVVDVGERYATTELTELDHFLTARWGLFSAPRSGLHYAPAQHDPWPLHRATATTVEDGLVAAAGLPQGTSAAQPIVHYSPSVEVRIGWPMPAAATSRNGQVTNRNATG